MPLGKRNHVQELVREGAIPDPDVWGSDQFRFVEGTDPFHLIAGVIDWILQLGTRGAYAKQAIRDKLIEHKDDIARYGDDMSEARLDARAAAMIGRAGSTEGDNL